jgi:hypothetical protein
MPLGSSGHARRSEKEPGPLHHVLLGFFENMNGRLLHAGHLVAGILRRQDQFIELELKRWKWRDFASIGPHWPHPRTSALPQERLAQ